MQLRIAYTTTEAPEAEVVTTPFSVMQWERKYKTKISKIEEDGLGIEDLLYLGWEAVKTTGTVVPPFEVWAATVTNIRTVGDGDEARPTPPAR